MLQKRKQNIELVNCWYTFILNKGFGSSINLILLFKKASLVVHSNLYLFILCATSYTDDDVYHHHQDNRMD